MSFTPWVSPDQVHSGHCINSCNSALVSAKAHSPLLSALPLIPEVLSTKACPFFPIQYVGVSYNHFFCHAKACRNKCPTKPAIINANIQCRCVRRLQTPGSGYCTLSTLGALHLRLLHCTTSATSACNLHTAPSEYRGAMSLVRRHHLQGTTMFVGVSCKSFSVPLTLRS